MAKVALKAGTTSYRTLLFIQDSSSTVGAGRTGLVFNTAGLTCYYARPGATAVAVTLAAQTVTGAFSSGGFVEIDATNMPGVYRLDIPDAALASGAPSVVLMLRGAANMAPLALEIELTATDNQDAVRGGMTALPNAAAEAPGGLYTRGTGAGQIAQDAAGRINVNAVALSGTAQTARDIGASVLLSPGTGVGQIALSSGAVTAGTVTDKAGYSLSAAGVQAIWDALTSALTLAGSIGKKLADLVLGTDSRVILSANAHTGAVIPTVTTVTNDVGITQAGADKVWASASRSLTSFGPLVSDIAAAVWAAATRTLTGFGSLVSDIWNEALPGAYGAGTAGSILPGRAAPGAEMTLSVTERNNVADALLKRDLSLVTGEAARSPLNALRALRNKVSISGGTMTVTKEDDSTAAWTATVTTDALADPITAVDPS